MEGEWTMEVGLTWLLRAAWFVGTLPILVASIPSSRLSPLHGVLSEYASRGKTRQSSSQVCLCSLFLSSFNLCFVRWLRFLFYLYFLCRLKLLLLVVWNGDWFRITALKNLNILIFLNETVLSDLKYLNSIQIKFQLSIHFWFQCFNSIRLDVALIFA